MDQEELQSPESSEVDDLRQELAQWKDLAVRRLAEVENIRRRTTQERAELLQHAAEHTIMRMLPVLDDLHAAVESARGSSDAESLKQGIEMIYTKALRIFEDSGVRIIEAAPGEQFNVDMHEALVHQPSNHPEGSVVQIIQRGYQLHEKVLRHAKVITSAGLPEHKDKA